MLLLVVTLVHNITPPDFALYQSESADGSALVAIVPNFVVNSIHAITVDDADRTIVSQRDPSVGLQVLTLPSELRSGDLLTVKCDLQYDHWMAPCITTLEKRIVLEFSAPSKTRL